MAGAGGRAKTTHLSARQAASLLPSSCLKSATPRAFPPYIMVGLQLASLHGYGAACGWVAPSDWEEDVLKCWPLIGYVPDPNPCSGHPGSTSLPARVVADWT